MVSTLCKLLHRLLCQSLFLMSCPSCLLIFSVNNVHSYTSIASNDVFRLWRCRLGHPSSQRLALMKSIVPNYNSCNVNKVFECNVFPLAKQKRLPFPHSITASLSCFDLVHVDIWGPYSTPTLSGSKYFLPW